MFVRADTLDEELPVTFDASAELANLIADDETGCAHVSSDATKNRSRRFCSDQRCASRTHRAAHRARRARAG